MFLIVGLGNPGKKYRNTRHNVGFMALEEIAGRLGVGELKLKARHRSLTAEAVIEGKKAVLAEPQTFMNLSGEAVASLMRWYKVPASRLIVLHDDVDIELGTVKKKVGGGSAGHHGIESIVSSINNRDFARVRIGIGRDRASGDVSGYVLDKIPPSQAGKIDEALEKAADMAISLMKG